MISLQALVALVVFIHQVTAMCINLLPQVNVILKHEKFRPLSSPGGDGRNDVALLQIRNRGGRGIRFDKFVRPACLPAQGERLHR